MYSGQFDYYRAKSVAEAGTLLKQHPGAKLLAGGHRLIPLLKLRLATPSALIDIGRIAELKGIDVEGRRRPDRRVDDACGARRRRPCFASSVRRWPRQPATSAIRPFATAARSAATWRTPIPRPICRRC